VKPSARFKTARYLTRWELCLDILDQLAADVEALKSERQYTGPRTAPIDDPSDPVHPGPTEQPRLEAWALTTLDGDTDGVWFERTAAEPITGEEVQHRLVELRKGEQIAPAGSVVLTAEQAERVWKLYHASKDWSDVRAGEMVERDLDLNEEELMDAATAFETDDLRALGIEVDRG